MNLSFVFLCLLMFTIISGICTIGVEDTGLRVVSLAMTIGGVIAIIVLLIHQAIQHA